MPGIVLALTLFAVPAGADPGGNGDGGRSGEAPGVTGGAPPAPDHAAAPDAVGPPAGTPQGPPAGVPQGPPAGVPEGPPADVPPGPPADVPQGPPADVPAAGQGPKDAPPAAAPAAKGKKVVVCKYVRKPGVAEIFSHIIVVNENALLGKGFAGNFPFAFSDAHFKSVAVRYAAKGEQAREISPSACPGDVPPGEEPPGEEPPGGGPGDVGGIVEDRPADVAAAREPGAALPNTGAPADLTLLALLGGLGSLAGVWLVARSVRGRRTA